jgi:hypothetical protein
LLVVIVVDVLVIKMVVNKAVVDVINVDVLVIEMVVVDVAVKSLLFDSLLLPLQSSVLQQDTVAIRKFGAVVHINLGVHEWIVVFGP